MARLVERVSNPRPGAQELARLVVSAGEACWLPGARVRVGEGQAAVFSARGKVCDALATGEHRLSALTTPQLAALTGPGGRGLSPFSADLFYVNLREIRNLRWRTERPVRLPSGREAESDRTVHLRGALDVAVADPVAFLQCHAPASGSVFVDDILDSIVATLREGLAEQLARDAAPARMDERGLAALNRGFRSSGLRITALYELVIERAADGQPRDVQDGGGS